MHVHRGRIGKETVHGRQIKIFLPDVDSGASENDLRNFQLTHKIRHRSGYDISFELDEFRAQVFRKTNIGSQCSRTFTAARFAGLNMNHIESSVQPVRHARAAGDELLRCWIRADAYGHALAHSPVLVDTL